MTDKNKEWEQEIERTHARVEAAAQFARMEQEKKQKIKSILSGESEADREALSAPVLCRETIYEDDEIRLEKVWSLTADKMYYHDEVAMVITEDTLNEGVQWFSCVTADGKKLGNLYFTEIDRFHEGLAVVKPLGQKLGYMDLEGQIVIPAIYDRARDFQNGMAWVMRDGKRYFVDKTGKEISVSAYEVTGDFVSDVCLVSTENPDNMSFHTNSTAGNWGLINRNGEEIVPPQYIYANITNDGIVLVCNGEHMWGAIDTEGNPVIPFLFDDIKCFNNTNEAFLACYDGAWGALDKAGQWLAEPMFSDIEPYLVNGKFVFSECDKEESTYYDDEELLGIYDINRHSVMFEPEFEQVCLKKDGTIQVEVYDEENDDFAEIILDENGNNLFPSVYTSFIDYDEYYKVEIIDYTAEEDEYGDLPYRFGLIDKKGEVILPCNHDSRRFDGVHPQYRLLSYKDDKKIGLCDYSYKMITPPIYKEISAFTTHLLRVQTGDSFTDTEGLIKPDGTIVLQPEYGNIFTLGDSHILCRHGKECMGIRMILKK